MTGEPVGIWCRARRLLIGAGYVDIGWLHMGFRPAFGYRRVWELLVDAGRLIAAHDRSAPSPRSAEPACGTSVPPGCPVHHQRCRCLQFRKFSRNPP